MAVRPRSLARPRVRVVGAQVLLVSMSEPAVELDLEHLLLGDPGAYVVKVCALAARGRIDRGVGRRVVQGGRA